MKSVLLPLSLLCLILASCAPSTPLSRIEKHPTTFNRLPQKHQELVSQGKISEGMSTAAVRIAIGNPSSVLYGENESIPFERWDYTKISPTSHSGISYHHGFGRRYYRDGSGHLRRRYPYSGFGFHQSVRYQRKHFASVWFENGRVKRWEKRRSY